MTDTKKRMTNKEWQAEAERRFGKDILDWKFVCPSCGHIQAVRDFKEFKDVGATPESAYKMCIGRFLPENERRAAFGKHKPVEQPCDYAAYGLFRISPVEVVTDGMITESFDFAPGDPDAQRVRQAPERLQDHRSRETSAETNGSVPAS